MESHEGAARRVVPPILKPRAQEHPRSFRDDAFQRLFCRTILLNFSQEASRKGYTIGTLSEFHEQSRCAALRLAARSACRALRADVVPAAACSSSHCSCCAASRTG